MPPLVALDSADEVVEGTVEEVGATEEVALDVTPVALDVAVFTDDVGAAVGDDVAPIVREDVALLVGALVGALVAEGDEVVDAVGFASTDDVVLLASGLEDDVALLVLGLIDEVVEEAVIDESKGDDVVEAPVDAKEPLLLLLLLLLLLVTVELHCATLTECER